MRLRTAFCALLVTPLIALAACGVPTSGTGGSSAAATSAASTAESSAASSSAAPLGPSVPAETTIAAAVDRSRMPTATGSFGDKPTIKVPSTPPPDTLQRVILSKGDGPTVSVGDWLQVNYLGQVWGGKVFDNSYDRGTEFLFQVGASPQQVVDGWDVGLRGVTQGSRVLLSFPPQDGYGSTGNPPDISGSDTLIFVVDVDKIIPADAGGQTDAAPQSTPSGLPSVGGSLGAVPTLSVPTSLAAPTKTTMTILAKGTGDPVQAGDVLVQYVASTWDGTETEQSWPDPSGKNANAGIGPAELGIDSGGAFDSLIGVPLGSRVLVTMAADSTNGTPALAWVMDLVLQKDLASSSSAAASGTGTNAPPTAPTS